MGAPPPGFGFAMRSHLTMALGLHSVAAADNLFGMHPLVCIDPVGAMNNTAKACYRVAAVQKVFADAAAALSSAAEQEDDVAGRALASVAELEAEARGERSGRLERVVNAALESAAAHSASARS